MKTVPKHTLDYLDSWLSMRSKWDDAPGFVIAVAKDGKVLFNKAYGLANIEKKEAMTPNHIFRIASHSKMFTATAILQLQENGKLRIDDNVVNYLPWLKKHKDGRWKTVTIRQLLSHSAGVIRDGLDSDYWTVKRPFPSTEQLHKAILDADLIIEPNTKMKYSNYGYSLLGEVVETVSGVSYNDYVKNNIINALKLNNTQPEITSEPSRLATGYTRQNLKKQRLAFPNIDTNAMSAATGFCSTAEDLCTYMSALLPGSQQLLTDQVKREMQRAQWPIKGERGEHYGLGVDIKKHHGKTIIGHGGGFPGYITRSSVRIDDSLVVVVLSNAHGAWSGVMAKGVYAIIDLFGEKPPKATLLKYEGRFAGIWGAYDIIATDKGLLGAHTNSWFPVDSTDKLEVIDDQTLKIHAANDYDSDGENILYNFKKDGSVDHIIQSGTYLKVSTDGDLVKTWQ